MSNGSLICGKGERPLILVVDDNKDVCEYVSDVLSNQFDVVTALNGRLGFEKATQYVPDLVLSDVMMPEMDGTALCKKIKHDRKLSHIPVMLLTAKASIEIKLEGLEGGADDYLAKPFNARELHVRVKNLLRLREQEKELRKLNYGLEQKVAEQMEVILAERQQYEDQLIQEKERAEASSRLKEVMLDNMNHELRTPLAGIMGLADVLIEDAPEPLTEMAVLVKENGERLLRTLNTIVDLSLIQNDEFKVYQSHVDLHSLIQNILSTYQPGATVRGIEMRFSFNNDKQLWIHTDSNLLSKIVTELVDNALKFTEEGFVEIGIAQKKDDEVTITVIDSGTGVHPDFLESVWDAFVQESDGLTRSHEGLGIGLTLAKEFAHLLGGTLELTSEVGEGTSAYLTIPVKAPNATTETPAVMGSSD